MGVWTARFSPDGETLLSGSDDGYLIEWDVQSGERRRVLLDPKGEEDDRPRIVDEDGREVDAGFRILRLSERMRGSSIVSTCFSPDGRRFVVGAANGQVVIWNASSRGELDAWQAHDTTVDAIAVSPDGRWLATGTLAGGGDSLSVWRMNLEHGGARTPAFSDGSHIGGVSSVCFSPDNRYVAAGGFTMSGYTGPLVYAVESGERTAGFCYDMTRALAFAPDGKSLATGDDFGTFSIWDVASRDRVFCGQAHADGIGALQFSPDGREVVTGSWDGRVNVWDLRWEEPRATASFAGIVLACRFGPAAGEVLVAEAERGADRPAIHRVRL